MLQRITDTCRACVGAFVRDRTGPDGRVSNNSFQGMLRMAGLAKQPWDAALKEEAHQEFRGVKQEDMKAVFTYLEYCLEQVRARCHGRSNLLL